MLLLSTSSLRWYWLHKIFIFAKKSWYDGIDLHIDHSQYDTWDKDYIKSLSDTYGVPVFSITAPEKWINKNKVDEIVDLARILWAQVVTFSPPRIMDKSPEWFTKYLKKLSRDYHLAISAQNVEPKMIFFLIPEYRSNNLIDIKKATGYTSLNLWNIEKSTWVDILRAYQMLWNTIKNVYLSDKVGPKKWLLPWKSWWDTSTLPLESFLMKLRANSYTGYISLNVKPEELWAWDDIEVLNNLDFVKTYYKKHFLDK